ncbi:MAG: helix-turn-helix domain-containing protein [Pleomorphochaeta sp.]
MIVEKEENIMEKMEIISTNMLADLVFKKRKEKKMSQKLLSEKTDINRALISRLENDEYVPSLKQLEALSDILEFNIKDLFIERDTNNSFIALKSEVLNEYEKKGVEKLFSMMLTLKQQIQIRKTFENGKQ